MTLLNLRFHGGGLSQVQLEHTFCFKHSVWLCIPLPLLLSRLTTWTPAPAFHTLQPGTLTRGQILGKVAPCTEEETLEGTGGDAQ